MLDVDIKCLYLKYVVITLVKCPRNITNLSVLCIINANNHYMVM